jgi:hypothetical protein
VADSPYSKLERALSLPVTVLQNMDLGQLQSVAQTVGTSARAYARNPRSELIRRILVQQEAARKSGSPPAPDAYRTMNSVAALTVAIRVLRRSRDRDAGTALVTLVALREALQDSPR